MNAECSHPESNVVLVLLFWLRKECSLRAPKEVLYLLEDFTGFVDFFRFCTCLRNGHTQPAAFQVSEQRIVARAQLLRREGCQILLEPSVSVGTHTATFYVVDAEANFSVGVTDKCHKRLRHGCSFSNWGTVCVDGRTRAYERKFGGWKTGDLITIIADLDLGKVRIVAPFGEYSCAWRKPRGTRVCFGFYAYGDVHSGAALSVVAMDTHIADAQIRRHSRSRSGSRCVLM